MLHDPLAPQQVVETERLILRPLRRSDAGLMSLYGGDPRVARMTMSVPHPLPPGTAEAFIERARHPERTEDTWAIDGTRCGLGELVGVIGLERIDRAQSEIGYWVAPGLWNTGIASEAVGTLVRANPQGLACYFASVFQDNPASARVLTNVGFRYLGDAEAWCVARGAKVATWTYMLKMA